MRALQAGMTTEENTDRLLIALEPEAASIYVRTLRLYQLVPEAHGIQSGGTPRSTRSSCCFNEDDFWGSSKSNNFFPRTRVQAVPISDIQMEAINSNRKQTILIYIEIFTCLIVS